MTARPAPRARRLAATLTALLTAATLSSLAACSSNTSAAAEPSATASDAPAAALAEAGELRLGYFANLTHALPLIGVEDGTYQKTLGDTKLTTTIFNAGPEAVEGSSAARSTPRTSARTRPSTRSRSRTARRSGSSPARPPAAPSSS